jgi:hypothetical protein
MLIYGNTPRDIRAMIWRRRYRFVSVFAVIGLLICLTGCGTAKPSNSMSEFWKAIASGDISVLKKIKGAGDKEDGSWDSIEDKVE